MRLGEDKPQLSEADAMYIREVLHSEIVQAEEMLGLALRRRWEMVELAPSQAERWSSKNVGRGIRGQPTAATGHLRARNLLTEGEAMKSIMLGLFVALPLQWFALGSTPVGTPRLHQVAVLGMGLFILARYRAEVHTPLIRTTMGFLIANLYMFTVWAAVGVYNGITPFGPVEQFFYLAAFLALGTMFYRAASGIEADLIGVLRWAALATCVSVLAGFAVSMAINGVNPAAVLARTVGAADPNILQQEVFKSSFANLGLDEEAVAGNLRHEIFGSVLFAMYVSTWAMRVGAPVSFSQRIGYQAAMIAGTVLLTLSLSRSVLIAALLWPAIVFWRSMLLGRLSIRQLGVALFGVVGVGLLLLSGFAQVLWNRFTVETTGYGSRAENYVAAFSELREHWLTGGVVTRGLHVSTHNFVMDNWLRGGIFTALAAAAVFALVALVWLRLLIRIHHQPEWMVPVVAALALPLVRMSTAGGGLIPPVEWVALAFVAGILAVRQEQRQVTTEDHATLTLAKR